jgi:hypothetical protein
LILSKGRDFSLIPGVRAGSGAHLASYTRGTRGCFPGGVKWQGHEADHSTSSCDKFKKSGVTSLQLHNFRARCFVLLFYIIMILVTIDEVLIDD